ncbi:hypothetical protein Pan241w_26460 [Gimesia alba]|uniref:Uncharacterized protein n=1 Tax=Gimesia alba TaxID=2527973 RepID=A0A517RFA8_9PLAN|nr:hypothetical protein [Gimesia alba]QDT42561.1 hypothetical protein Pan241w_26460 [Gimesia alba]
MAAFVCIAFLAFVFFSIVCGDRGVNSSSRHTERRTGKSQNNTASPDRIKKRMVVRKNGRQSSYRVNQYGEVFED